MIKTQSASPSVALRSSSLGSPSTSSQSGKRSAVFSSSRSSITCTSKPTLRASVAVGFGDVPRAEQPQPRRRQDWFHENLHSAPAAHAEIVRQIPDQAAGSRRVGHARALPTPRARSRRRRPCRARSHLRAEQPRTGLLRRRSGRAHDGGQSPALTARQQLEQSLNDIAHRLRMCQDRRFVQFLVLPRPAPSCPRLHSPETMAGS